MNLEIEATFVEVNKADLRQKLKAAGAELLASERLMRRVVFDTGANSFARVRDEGDGHTIMTYKRHNHDSLTGTEEINVEVDNYENAVAFLQACGLRVKAVQDSYRESWRLGQAEIDIDTWPWLPSYVELEGETAEAVKQLAAQLGFKMEDAIYGSVDNIFVLYYDVTQDYINSNLPEIKFVPAPSELADHLRTAPLAPAKVQADPSGKADQVNLSDKTNQVDADQDAAGSVADPSGHNHEDHI